MTATCAGVDVGIEDEVVERAAEAPGPEADGAPGVGCVVDGTEEIARAVLAGVFEVGLEVAVVGGGEAVAAREQHLDLPLIGGAAAGVVGGRDVLEFGGAFGLNPDGRGLDGGVVEDGLIAEEVEAEDDGHGMMRGGGGGGDVDEEAHGALGLRGRCDAGSGIEGEVDLLANGEAVERVLVVLDDAGVGDGVFGCGGCDAEDVLFEEAEDLGAALGGPLLRRGDGAAVGEAQRVEEGVGRNFGFVVVVAGDVLGADGKDDDKKREGEEGGAAGFGHERL